MNDTEFRGRRKKKTVATELSIEEEQSRQDEEGDITMGEILLSCGKGFDSGVMQTRKGNEAVENLNDEMNDTSEHGNSRKGEGSTASKEGVGIDHNNESQKSGEGSGKESGDYSGKEDAVVGSKTTVRNNLVRILQE